MGSALLEVRMKISVIFAEISAKFHVSKVGETKEGGEMSTEEISVNFAKNRRNFGKRRNFGDFFKKSPSVGKFRRKIVLFRFISAIFWQKKQKFSYQSSPRTGYKILS